MRRPKREFFLIKSFTRRYDKRENKFIINIAYETAVEPTSRIKGVAEAFGLGLDQQKFIIYDNVELKIGPTDIVYITGESGSGKSALLKAIKEDLGQEATDLAEIQPNPEKPIIETVGKNLSQALELLSKAGLNDAFILTRRCKELSDGQKYRYKIAKLMEKSKKWWIADEFCSILDRDTAKIVAYNLQKTARKMHKALIVATTHTDLFQDLNPTVHIHKSFGKEIKVNYYPNKPAEECSLVKEMHIEEGTLQDYKKLSQFHYRSVHCQTPRKIFTLKRGEEACGVIVYSHPPPTMPGRNKVWKGNIKKLQKEISTITRVVIHPKYRAIGLGQKLVKETLTKAGTPYVETLAVMAKYNPFFEKAGMQKITESQPNKHLLKAIEELQKLGFNPAMLGSINHNIEKIKHANKEKIIKILKTLSKRNPNIRKRLISSKKA
ncbi:MAG: ATP-binding cassette domain-containing protein [Candidatus Bathyarchaeia archaeon]